MPQEKTARCNSGEAFDSGERKCVATLSSSNASIASITPASSYTISNADTSRTHSISVSDLTGSGFSVRWEVIAPNGNTTLLGTGLSLTFNHTSFVAGVYILEVKVLDTSGAIVSDSRNWSVNIIDETTPHIAQITGTPFSTTITSAPTTINASLNNPDLIANVNIEWSVNGSVQSASNFSTATRAESFSFDPRSGSGYFTGSNTYTVQLTLKENITNAIYTTAIWTINNSLPGLASPILSATSPTVGLDNIPVDQFVVQAIDKDSIGVGGFLADLNGNNIFEASEEVDFCVELEDTNTIADDEDDGINNNGVFIDFQSNGVVIATAQFTAENTPICLSVENPGFFQSIPANIVAETQSLKAIVYDRFTGNTGRPRYKGFTELISFDWPTRVRQKNTPPRITIVNQNPGNLNNNPVLFPNNNNTQCDVQTPTTFSQCTVTQGQRTGALAEVPFAIGIEIDDDDYNSLVDLAKFRVEFFLDGILLDGNHPLSGSDCFHDFGEVVGAASYICQIQLNPYDSNGPINPAGLNYTITAKVTDLDSPFIVASSSESNILNWRIATVNDFNSGTNLNAFGDAPVVGDTASFVRRGGANITLATDIINEMDNIVFHVSSNDLERDTFTLNLFRCNDNPAPAIGAPCVDETVPLATAVFNSVNANNPKIVTLAHTISQDALNTQAVNDDETTVRYRISVTDSDSSTASTDVDLRIQNVNQNPVFNTAQFNPALPLTSSLIAFTGFPMTIDPGSVTDSSLSDGENIRYQWLINIDANNDGNFTNDSGYRAIPGAISRVLAWSPGQEIDLIKAAGLNIHQGTAVKLKLCVGDDGLIDGTTDSKNPEGLNQCPNNISALDTSGGVDANAWDVTVFSNMTKGRSDEDGAGNKSFNNSSHPNGELAIWVDPRSSNPVIKYMAYVNSSREIVIEKILTNADGTKAGSARIGNNTAQPSPGDIEFIAFPHSTDTNFANNIVTNLSMTGDIVNNFLYLAYMAPIGGVDQVHIRRINIGGGKTAFAHDGKFGFDRSYSGMLASPNPLITDNSGNINITQNASTNGLVQVEFTAVPTLGVNVSFNGFTLGGLATLSAGTDFCGTGGAISGCATTADTAASFMAAINNSLNPELQGISATHVAGSNIVVIQGMADGEFLESNISAQDLGEIYINQNLNKWVLPYINGGLPAPNKNKVSLFNGDLNTRLIDSNPASTNLIASTAADEIANDMDSNERIIVATKTEISGEIAVMELDNFHNIVDGVSDLFSDTNISQIKVTVGKETSEFDQSAFIMGSNQNNRLAFARIDAPGEDFNFATAIIRVDLDPTYRIIEGITNYDITAGNEQNQLLVFGIVDADVDGQKDEAVMFQITGATTPVIDCSSDASAVQNDAKCMRITTGAILDAPAVGASEEVFNLRVALAEVMEDVTMGTDGATTGESIQDVLPIAFHADDGGGSINDDAQPNIGLINISGTSLSVDETGGNNIGEKAIIPYVK